MNVVGMELDREGEEQECIPCLEGKMSVVYLSKQRLIKDEEDEYRNATFIEKQRKRTKECRRRTWIEYELKMACG